MGLVGYPWDLHGPGTSICFYHSLRACVHLSFVCWTLCVKCWTSFALFATSMWDVDLGVILFLWRHDIGHYLWLRLLWGEICIGTSILFSCTRYDYFHKPQPLYYHVSSFCKWSCPIYHVIFFLWHPLPICGFPLICATCVICTHVGGGAIFVTWYDLFVCKS